MADKKGNGEGFDLEKAVGGFRKGIGAVKKVVNVFKRNPSVKAWAKSKRAEKRRLKKSGLRGSKLRSALASWAIRNPKPTGRRAHERVKSAEREQLVPQGTTAAIFEEPQTRQARNPLMFIVLIAIGFLILTGGKFKL